MKNPLVRMLNSPSKGIEETRGLAGVLARLWRKILADRNIRLSTWGDLMRDYVREQRGNTVEQTSLRGNLAKGLSKKDMTWKVFCKGLQLLGYREFTFTITAKDKRGNTFVHETSVEIAGSIEPEDDSDNGDEK